MCGIAGALGFGRGIDAGAVEAMAAALARRGPDDTGLWRSARGSCVLAHRRLAFLGLGADGRQPLRNETDDVAVVANGEIYNHRALRRELEAAGHRFRSQSDSEVIVHGYEEWGVEPLLRRLRGMFAFALRDETQHRLVLARDRFGIKPLYYRLGPEDCLFASQPRGLLAHPAVSRRLDARALADFFVYRYVPSPGCIWQGLAKLPPAHVLVVGDDGSARATAWWTLSSGGRAATVDEVGEVLDGTLATAVGEHLDAEVPMGALLSAGLDSAAVVRQAVRHRPGLPTFTIGFDGWEGSEHEPARSVAARFGTRHRERILGPESLDLLDVLADVYDEPLADISTVPTFAVSHLAARHVKGVLSGEGGDELLLGYAWAREIVANPPADHDPDGLVARYAAAMAMGAFDAARLRDLFAPGLQSTLADDPCWFWRSQDRPDLPLVRRLQWLDLRTFLGELVLAKVDRASMWHGLEVRVPFLDPLVVDPLLELEPGSVHVPGVPKAALRDRLVHDVPPAVLARPKQGFVGPDAFYAEGGWPRVLDDSRLVRDGVLRAAPVLALRRERDTWRLWKLAVAEHWYRRWVVGAAP